MRLSVVVPAFNEEASIEPLAARLAPALDATGAAWRVLIVDDGSTDGTLAALRRLAQRDPRFAYRSLSRNFGHEAATTAGLDETDGDATIVIDADLQDPPELIPKMVERWQTGAMVVLARRTRRAGERAWRRGAASAFYRLLDALSELRIPRDVGDFRLMDRRVVEAVRQCREEPRYMRGLFAWSGFRTETIDFARDERQTGAGHYRLGSLIRLAFDALTGFSVKPLRLVLWVGFLMLSAGLAWLAVLGIIALTDGATGALAIMLAAALTLTGAQITATGIVAAYLAPVVRGTRGRPVYIIAEESPAQTLPAPATGTAALIEPKPATTREPAPPEAR